LTESDDSGIIRVITDEEFFDYLRYLLKIVKEESHKRIASSQEGAGVTSEKENLQWYFRGYEHGVEVFFHEFWDRIRTEDWKIASRHQQ